VLIQNVKEAVGHTPEKEKARHQDESNDELAGNQAFRTFYNYVTAHFRGIWHAIFVIICE
jgi:hypothetical protein